MKITKSFFLQTVEERCKIIKRWKCPVSSTDSQQTSVVLGKISGLNFNDKISVSFHGSWKVESYFVTLSLLSTPPRNFRPTLFSARKHRDKLRLGGLIRSRTGLTYNCFISGPTREQMPLWSLCRCVWLHVRHVKPLCGPNTTTFPFLDSPNGNCQCCETW